MQKYVLVLGVSKVVISVYVFGTSTSCNVFVLYPPLTLKDILWLEVLLFIILSFILFEDLFSIESPGDL